MPRIPRADLATTTPYFHVICRGNNHAALFHNEEDYEVFRGLVRRYRDRWPFDILHYIWMTTHIHLAIHLIQFEHMARAFHAIQFTYCRYYQRKYALAGHLWHSRFRSVPIASEAHLLRGGRYTVLNCVRADMVKHPSEYPWSSYHAYASGMSDDLVTWDPIYETLGDSVHERQLTYREYIEEGMKSDWEAERALFEPYKCTDNEKPNVSWQPLWCK